MIETQHAHAYKPVGYCQHPHALGVNEHRVYRCGGCGAFAHSRTPFRRVGGRRLHQATRCPVSPQQAEVEAWERHNRERTEH